MAGAHRSHQLHHCFNPSLWTFYFISDVFVCFLQVLGFPLQYKNRIGFIVLFELATAMNVSVNGCLTWPWLDWWSVQGVLDVAQSLLGLCIRPPWKGLNGRKNSRDCFSSRCVSSRNGFLLFSRYTYLMNLTRSRLVKSSWTELCWATLI